MDEITLKKDRVLEAASKCSTAKRTLEILCPEFFEKQKFEKGQWVKNGNGQTMFIYDDPSDRTGFNSSGEWTVGIGRAFDDRLEPATPQEIEKALIAEAEKRGFKEGVRFKTASRYDSKNICKGKLKYGWYNGDNLYFTSCDGLIYSEGKWAEIIPSKKKMTLKEVEEKLGYEIEITNA